MTAAEQLAPSESQTTQLNASNGEPSTRITPREVLRQIPFALRKFPELLKGYYYFALLKPKKQLTMANILEANAEQYSTRPAVYYQDRSLTYAELNGWANQFAHYFRAQRLVRGDAIAIALENRPEIFAALMGAAKIGVAAAMINTSQRGEVLAHSLKITAPKLVVVGEELVDNFATLKDHIPQQEMPPLHYLADTDTRQDAGNTPKGYENLARAIEKFPQSNPRLNDAPTAGDTAVYLFTSGTTGMPKAAPSSHRKWFKAYGGFGHMSLGMTPNDVIYVTLPLYHGTGLLVCWGAALAGASAIAVRRKFSASEFWKDVRNYRATCFGYVGELCRYLMSQPPQPDDRQHQVRKIIGNGLRPSLWPEFKERFNIEQVVELYAASEGNIGFSNFLNLDNTVGFTTAPFALVKFHEGTREPLRDDKGRLIKVEKGEPGLLLGKITPKWNFEGYSQKDATEKAICRDAFRKGDAWFNTGDVLKDIGCRHLQFVDRMGDTFRWKGENVSTTEVENILDKFSQLEEAIVYGVEIPHTNGRAGMVTVTLREGEASLDTHGLVEHLRANLPAYAIPVFVRVTPEIEKTGTFKYRKVDLKKQGFQLDNKDDQVWVLLPGAMDYQPLTPETLERIDKGDYRF